MPEGNAEGRYEPEVPWTGWEIILVFLVGFVGPSAVYLLLDGAGFYRWFYGGDELREAVKAGGAAGQLAQYRLGLWAGCLGAILQVASALTILCGTSGATAADLGLTRRNLGRNVGAGLLFALIILPGAYALNWLSLLVIRQLGGEEQPHPFTQLGQAGLQPVEWVLLITTAVALAPLWEELLYRGIVQPWVMTRQPWAGPAVLAIALAMTVATRGEQMKAAMAGGVREMRVESLPITALLALAVVYFYLASMDRFREVGREAAGRFRSATEEGLPSGIGPSKATEVVPLAGRRNASEIAGLFATAVLFAWIHARVWPSPVPLLWLALGLGWLRWRGRSLAGSIVLHAVFNAVACLVLVWMQKG